MHLIIYGDVLFSYTEERQHELIRLFAFSLAHTHGYLVLGRTENITVSAVNFEQVSETVPIYQSIIDAFGRKTASNHSAASILKQVLLHKELNSTKRTMSPAPISLQEVLFRLAPIGIVVIDHTYRIVTANRAAHRLCSLPEDAHQQDFLHVVLGLPYLSVREAIDMTFCEGSTQNIPEVELMLTRGGNGRVLNMQISLLPAEVTTPDYVVLYIQEVTDQVIIKQAYNSMRETLQNLQVNHSEVMQKHAVQVQVNAQLQETNTEVLSLYEQLQVEFEECQTTKEALEQDIDELQAELETVCDTLSLTLPVTQESI